MLSDPPISSTTVTCEEKSENLQIKPKQVTKLQKNTSKMKSQQKQLINIMNKFVTVFGVTKSCLTPITV